MVADICPPSAPEAENRLRAFTRRDLAVVAGLAGAGWVASRILRDAAPLGWDVSSNAMARAAIAERTSRSAGNPQGSVTLVAFNDFLCPVCKLMAPDLAAAVRRDGDVRIEYRDLSYLGPMVERAALIGFAVDRQSLYPAYHDRMMAVRRPLDNALFRSVVEGIGADWAKVVSDLQGHRSVFRWRLQQDTNLAFALGIKGTPAFLIGQLLAYPSPAKPL